jgi:D-alanyl-lipoteichoic acid acyltransferase DltB (MBOAT superfamily)
VLRYTFVDQRSRLFTLILLVAGVVVLAAVLAANLFTMGSLSALRTNQLSLALSGVALLVAATVSTSSASQRHLGAWVLVAVGVLAAALAANLLIVDNFPGPAFKQLMLASVVLGAVLTGAAPLAAATGKTAGEEAAGMTLDRVRMAKFAGLVLQLALLLLVARQFELENQALYAHVLPLVFYGFLIHYFLPLTYRLPFFILLSLVAFLGILGFANGLYLIGAGLVLIAICHLPLRFGARIAILLAAVAGVVLLRSEWFPTLLPGVIWPVLGSLFMFRLILYLYDLKHSKTPPSLQSALAYFFLLPNVVFLLFPVVDYGTFRRTYYNEEEHHIYQTGVKWMFWGIVHLLLYRFVNYYLVLAPQQVANAGDLIHYMAANFLLLLRVSGQFHLIVGILHLFGFNLPRTFRDYFVANSFTDFWRRANPYWRDLMVKICYYPVYFRLDRFGTMSRLALATVIVFIATWFFHAYQWYWLRGSFLLSGPDIAFWALFGVVVLINSLREAKHGRKRSLTRKSWTAGEAVTVSLQAMGTFWTIAILYSLWTSSSLAEWLGLWRVIFEPLDGIRSLVPLLLVVGGLSAGAIWVHLVRQDSVEKPLAQPAYFRAMAFNGFLILFLFLAGNPAVYAQVGREMPAPIADLRSSRLSSRDADLLLQGYYENLIGVNRFNSDLWEIYSKRPADWPLLQDTELARMTGDFRITELVPNTRLMFHGAFFSVNRWGMRGRDYEQLPPPGTYRTAVVGPSFVMGSGVADSEVFVQLLEDRFNQEHAGTPYSAYEFLNFGMAGHSALQEVWIFESQALSFQPDAVLFVSHQREEDVAVRNLANRMQHAIELPYDYLHELAVRAGVEAGMTQVDIERRLRPYGPEIVSWSYERLVSLSRERDMVPIWVFMPILEAPLSEEERVKLTQQAEEAGFVTVDLSDVYQGFDLGDLIVAEWDMHPNATAHELMAERLYEKLVALGVIGNW